MSSRRDDLRPTDVKKKMKLREAERMVTIL
jgi:hypothetical protein